MAVKKHRSLGMFRKAASFLGAQAPSAALLPALLTVIALSTHGVAAAAEEPFCEGNPSPPNSVLIGLFAGVDSVPGFIESVRASFEVRAPNSGEEQEYTLKVFSVAGTDPPTEAQLLTTEWIAVNTEDPISPASVWIETPKLPMQWGVVQLEEPIEPEPGVEAFVFAIEMTLTQLESAGVLPYLEEVPNPENTYFSQDGGCSWTLLSDEEFDRLRGISGIDGSTYIRLRVRP